jgi:hypothetical protein
LPSALAQNSEQKTANTSENLPIGGN